MRELKAIFVLIMLGFFACKKVETPPPSVGDPVFSIEGNLDGNDLNITAGEDDYYLFTSHEIDEFNVRSFVATFAKIDCLDECQDTFRIIIRDAQQTSPANTGNINEALAISNYLYHWNDTGSETVIADTTFSYSFSFDASNSISSGVGNITYDWQIADYDTTTITSSLDYTFLGNPTDEIPLSLMVSDAFCSSSKTANVTLNTMGVDENCSVSIETNPAGTFLLANGVSDVPITYSWTTGEMTEIIEIQSGLEFYSVTTTDALGCESFASITLDSVGFVECHANFIFDANSEMIIENTIISIPGDSLQLSRISIEYIDENGNFYSTDLEEQPNNSKFSILNVADFLNNENDQKTKQLDIEFNAILFNENGLPALSLTQGKGKITVAYPD